VFALVLEQLAAFRKKKGHTLRKWYAELDKLKETCAENGLEWPAIQSRVETLRNREVKALLFDGFLEKIKSRSRGADGKIRSQSTLFDFF
jgi:hypothetical protein